MKNSDDVRRFYSQGNDAAWAFKHRLKKAVTSIEIIMPDYDGLTNALKYVPSSSSVAVFNKVRSDLLHAVSFEDFPTTARLMFLMELENVVRASGDTELICRIRCSYIKQVLNSLLFKPHTYAAGLRLLKICRDDCSVPLLDRARASLSMAEFFIKCGIFKQALMETRKAWQLSRNHQTGYQCFRTLGEIDLSRGMYRQAFNKFDRAVKLFGGMNKVMQYNALLASRWIISKMKSGSNYEAIDKAQILVSRKNWGGRNYLAPSFLMLELAKWEENLLPNDQSLILFDRLRKFPSCWRECCRLSISIADYLITVWKHDKSYKYIDYVIRLSQQYNSLVDFADALILTAHAHWCSGRFPEALKAVHRTKNILWNHHRSAKYGQIQLIRSKIAFYRNELSRAIKLSIQANESFSYSGARKELFNGVQILASAGICLGHSASVSMLLLKALDEKQVYEEPKSLMICYFLLASACFVNDKPQDAKHWVRQCGKVVQINNSQRYLSLKNLIESEAHCYTGEYQEATEKAQIAVDDAEKMDHKIFQAICKYQFIKLLILSKKNEVAQKYLENLCKDHPHCELFMWRHVRKAIHKKVPLLQDFKPVGSFPF